MPSQKNPSLESKAESRAVLAPQNVNSHKEKEAKTLTFANDEEWVEVNLNDEVTGREGHIALLIASAGNHANPASLQTFMGMAAAVASTYPYYEDTLNNAAQAYDHAAASAPVLFINHNLNRALDAADYITRPGNAMRLVFTAMEKVMEVVAPLDEVPDEGEDNSQVGSGGDSSDEVKSVEADGEEQEKCDGDSSDGEEGWFDAEEWVDCS